MSGYDALARALAGMSELGLDDPRVHEAFRSAIASGDLADEDEATAHGALGSCYHAIGAQEDAVDELERGIDLSKDPKKLAIMHHELGETFFVLDRLGEAEYCLKESLRLDREHPAAPDAMLLIGRVMYTRAEGSWPVLNPAYDHFAEALALLESPEAERYTTFHSREKAIFDSLFGMAVCKSEARRDLNRFEAAALFERAEQFVLEHRDEITDEEFRNLYRAWAALLDDMGLEREKKVVRSRWARNLRRE